MARIIGIIIEVLLLAALAYVVFGGVRLTLFDLGIKQKNFGRAITMVLLAVSLIIVAFFIAHLTTFYPPA